MSRHDGKLPRCQMAVNPAIRSEVGQRPQHAAGSVAHTSGRMTSRRPKHGHPSPLVPRQNSRKSIGRRPHRSHRPPSPHRQGYGHIPPVPATAHTPRGRTSTIDRLGPVDQSNLPGVTVLPASSGPVVPPFVFAAPLDEPRSQQLSQEVVHRLHGKITPAKRRGHHGCPRLPLSPPEKIAHGIRGRSEPRGVLVVQRGDQESALVFGAASSDQFKIRCFSHKNDYGPLTPLSTIQWFVVVFGPIGVDGQAPPTGGEPFWSGPLSAPPNDRCSVWSEFLPPPLTCENVKIRTNL